MRPPTNRASAGPPTAEVLSRIGHASMLVDRFGEWPTFSDAEVTRLQFNRGTFTNNDFFHIFNDLICEFVVQAARLSAGTATF